MFRLAKPQYLYLLLAIPVMILIYIYLRKRRKHLLSIYGDYELIIRLLPTYSGYRATIKFILSQFAYLLIIIGLASPQTGSKLEKIKREGVDMVFVLDVSNSMMAQDISPNRLERAKQSIIQFLNKLENDRLGLVVFAGKSYIQMPITTDFSATRLYLSNITPGMIPTQGTAIGNAIETASNCFGNTKQSKAIIIITDGENHEDEAIEAAKKANSKGIRIYTIGIGSPEGAPIPIYNGNTLIGYKKDAIGNTIISRLNEQMLKDIANAGGGIYAVANNSQTGINEVFKQINNLDKKEYSTAIFSDYEDKFQIFIFAALLILLLEFLLSYQKSKFAGKFQPFKTKTNPPQMLGILIIILFSSQFTFAQSTQKLIRSGNAEYKDGHFKEAEIKYRKAQASSQKSNKATFNLGNALYKQNNFNEAAQQYNSLLESKKTDASKSDILYNIGNSLLQDNKIKESIEAYKMALRQNPKDEDTRYNLAYALHKLQQQQKQKQQQQQEQKQQQQQQKEEQQKQPQPTNPDMSKNDAERMLNAMNNNEKRTLDKLKKKPSNPNQNRPEKDW